MIWGPQLVKPSFWKFWFFVEIFSKINFFRFFSFSIFIDFLKKMTPKNRKIEKSKKTFEKNEFSIFWIIFLRKMKNRKSEKNLKIFIFEKFSSKKQNFQNDGLRSRGPRLISSQNLRRDIVRKLHFWEFQQNRSLYIFFALSQSQRSWFSGFYTLPYYLSRLVFIYGTPFIW